MNSRDVARLGGLLDRLVEQYGGLGHIDSDPLSRVLPFEGARDREIVGFLAAVLSFGNVKAILSGIDAALKPLGDTPAEQLLAWEPVEARAAARGFRYRWIHEEDLGGLYVALGCALRAHGGLEPVFASGMEPGASSVQGGASALTHRLREWLPEDLRARRGARFLLADPDGAGASKRLHMFLRWMVRAEEPDLGLWSAATPAQLLMPMDTHVARIARYIGLTDRDKADRRAALEVTESLRRVNPSDPTRYDFAIARLGILGHCPHRRDPVRCAPCDLVSVCTL